MSTEIPKDYSIFPRELIKEGTTLLANAHVYLPQNQSIILFRKSGTIIAHDDIDSFKKIAVDKLLYANAEVGKISEMRAKLIAADLAKGDISSPAVKAAASGALQSMTPGQSISDSMNQAAQTVQNIMKNFKKSASVSAYDEALKKTPENESDPLAIHHKRVSAVSVLMALTVGDFSMDDISDLAAAGLLHDLGLQDITKSLSDSHFKGMKKFDNQEKLIYMRHVAHSLERIKKEKIPITPGVQRIIELHHENWNGSGFKSTAGSKIYRPARLMRIADDLVCLVQDSSDQLGFQQAIVQMSKEDGLYDPDMMKAMVAQGK